MFYSISKDITLNIETLLTEKNLLDIIDDIVHTRDYNKYKIKNCDSSHIAVSYNIQYEYISKVPLFIVGIPIDYMNKHFRVSITNLCEIVYFRGLLGLVGLNNYWICPYNDI